MNDVRPAAVMVLAAGAGTRMKSSLPKVLHPVAGAPMVTYALRAAHELRAERTVVVVRHEREQVAAAVTAVAPDVLIADQDSIPGTGRAVYCGLSVLDATAIAARVADAGAGAHALEQQAEGALVVMAGDVPLVDSELLGRLLDFHGRGGYSMTVLTAQVSDPTGYGRILRDDDGEVTAIVEQRDATPDQARITEINSGTYVFDIATLRGALDRLTTDNAQGEVYLTDVIGIARGDGQSVGAFPAPDPSAVEGVNDRVQLAAVSARMNERIVTQWMRDGVTVIDPSTTWIDPTVTLSEDVTILPGTQLHGETSVSTGATIGPDTTLTDVVVGDHATVMRTHGTGARIGERATVGPFSYLRPGSSIGTDGKVGTFVETKNATIGPGSKVPHLSYVGDATIGEGSNIGAATIFVNYDGVSKHHTTVGSHVRIGSDNTLVAPLTIGDGVYTGAGTTVRHDVPAGALAISSSPQQTVEGWVERRRPGTPSAQAALEARTAGDAGDNPVSSAEPHDAAGAAEGHDA